MELLEWQGHKSRVQVDEPLVGQVCLPTKETVHEPQQNSASIAVIPCVRLIKVDDVEVAPILDTCDPFRKATGELLLCEAVEKVGSDQHVVAVGDGLIVSRILLQKLHFPQ